MSMEQKFLAMLEEKATNVAILGFGPCSSCPEVKIRGWEIFTTCR